jgi:hypothetical protein
MLFVPRQPLRWDLVAPVDSQPRAVPLDAVVSLVSQVMPGWLLQRIVLMAIVWVAVVGAARLVPAARLGTRLIAGVVYGWTPFLAERPRSASGPCSWRTPPCPGSSARCCATAPWSPRPRPPKRRRPASPAPERAARLLARVRRNGSARLLARVRRNGSARAPVAGGLRCRRPGAVVARRRGAGVGADRRVPGFARSRRPAG